MISEIQIAEKLCLIKDKDLKDTVQRETEEEVNISKDNYDIIVYIHSNKGKLK